MENQSPANSIENRFVGFRLPRSEELPELDFYMDQIISIMEKNLSILSVSGVKFITPAMINNYVKLGIIPPPIKKRYTKEHICRLIIICALKSVIAIPAIAELIEMMTRTRPLYEVYDVFCEAYENMLCRAALTSKEIISEAEGHDEALSKLALFMAINAGTTQLIATETLSGIAPKESEAESEE